MPLLSLVPPPAMNARSIGGYVAQLTVSEDHSDEMLITEHPVEVGAVMSDHMYKRPPEVRVRVGWSAANGGYVDYVKEIYQALLDLQLARQLFEAYTGKRYYKNMGVASIHVLTDVFTEYVFLADVQLKQVFLSSTQTEQTTGLASRREAQANPGATGQTEDAGRQQLQSSGITAAELAGQPLGTTSLTTSPFDLTSQPTSTDVATINSNNGVSVVQGGDN